MFRINPVNDFSFENPKYLPEISASPYPVRSGSKVYQPNLKDRVEQIDSNEDLNHSVYAIDSSIWAKIFSELFRNDKAQYWQEKLGTAKQWAWIQGGVAALIALGAAGAAATKIHPYVVAATSICSVALMIFCGINLGKAFEASRQIKGWNTDPLKEIADARLKAYKEGFPYVFNKNLKLPPNTTSNCQILLPSEVKHLFKKYFGKFCTDLLSKKPSNDPTTKEWLRRFIDCNPIAKAVLTFVYEKVPENYEKISLDYGILHTHLTNTHSEYIRNNINTSRNLALAPLEAAFTYYVEKADTDRQENRKGKTDEEIQKIEEEYTDKASKYLSFHLAATAAINFLFDQKIIEAESNLQSVLNNIQTNEASSNAKHFDCAWKLLEGAKGLKEGLNNFSYDSPTFFSEEIVFDIPKTSLVAVEEAKKQRPENFDDSQYREYLEFVTYQPQEQ